MLFKDSPDLLGEFKAFFSEVPGSVIALPQPVLGSSWAQGESSPPNAPAKKPQTNKRTRKRPPEKDTTPIPLPKPLPQRVSLFNRIQLLKILTTTLCIAAIEEGQTSSQPRQ
jgi:paired amphipathic helix protein Sin3a